MSLQGTARVLTTVSLIMWAGALFLPAYIINPGVAPDSPPDEFGGVPYPETILLGYRAFLLGLLWTAMVFGIFAGTAAVFGNWIIVRGVFNYRAGQRKPVESLKWFAITHVVLLAVSLLAFGVSDFGANFKMYFNEGGVGVRGWLIGPATYVWYASLVTMTVANYCTLRWRQDAAEAPLVSPPHPDPQS